MNTTPPNASDNQEIDLNQLTKKISAWFNNFAYFVFNSIQFFLKHGIALLLLLILGLTAGYYLNIVQKNYDHKIIVIPNFDSAEYLYSKINLLNVKIKDNDTLFLKSLGIKDPKKLKKIEIEAVVDPYTFVKNSESNMELLKLIAEDGSMEKVVNEEMTSMKYEYHKIFFTTRDTINRDNTIGPIMKYLNDNNYFTLVQEQIIVNLKNKIIFTEQTLNQVNGILDNLAIGGNNNGGDSKLMYYNNENSQVDDILRTKDNLVSQLGYYKIELVNKEQIVKELSVIANLQHESSVPIMLPTLFVGLYIFIVFFIKFYKNQAARFKENAAN